tara:strand:- start:345 stop:1061 length:717 start_codon:yes stop_codon:yes gene_type:complete
MNYNPYQKLVGEFSINDGTIDFYLRIKSLLKEEFKVIDFGAGRASWFLEDNNRIRKEIRLIKGKVKKVIAIDIDQSVLENKASDEQILVTNNEIKIAKNSIDLIIADYVLEHIQNEEIFISQINKLLKSGGWFCARTPHKYSYVSLLSSIVKNDYHSKFLNKTQPFRKKEDVFATFYKLNTLRKIKKMFKGWENKSFIFKSDPAYYFGNKYIFFIQDIFHKISPKFLSGNIFIFVKKP